MMAGKSIVILGAGFGGITAALELRRELGAEHHITLLDRQASFMMGLRKLWILAGCGSRDEGTRSLDRLSAKGIHFRQTAVEEIDPRGRVIRTTAGPVRFDYLIVALGAEPRADLVPGFSSAAFNFYDAADVERLAGRVQALARGRVAIGIFGLPYKCPPAPYEAAMLLDDLYRQRGIRDRVEISVFTPQPMSLPVLGPAGCAQVEGYLADKRIEFLANRKTVRVDGTTAIGEGAIVEADLLIAVPPHRPPAVVRTSGLALRGEWIAVDPTTLQTSVEGIFAVGDVTDIPMANGISMPKAGILAEGQAKAAAGAIIAELTGRSAPDPYDGFGYCFTEVGGGQAAKVVGRFLAHPVPRITFESPTPEAYQEKLTFEHARLDAWF
jgi:sulfide:quinone oxidoreductase